MAIRSRLGRRTSDVLVVGDFRWEMYEPQFCAALRSVGARVNELHVDPLFGPGDLVRRAQVKYGIGPGPLAANVAMVATAARVKPGVILAWRTPWLIPLAVRAARAASGGLVVLYNNDDPFGPDRNLPIWRRFRRLIPAADACFAYRQVNLAEYREAGARNVALLRSYYSPWLHFPPALTSDEREAFSCDVTFIGHYEADDRVEHIERLLETDLRVRVFGSGWEDISRGRAWARVPPIRRLGGLDYAKALSAAKIALVFLSARNRDQYTRRCFEIPAVGTLMLAPRTPDLQSMYREDVEAAFFSSPGELVAQAIRYASDEKLRDKVARNGHERCVRDGHDVESRARRFLADVACFDQGIPAHGTGQLPGCA